MEWSRIDLHATLFTVVLVMLITVGGCIEPIPTDPEPFCGDGAVDTGEQCDYGAGNTNVACTPAYGDSCSYCTSTCVLRTVQGGSCGDGVCQTGETCDADCGSSTVPTDSFIAQYYSGMNFDTLFEEREEAVIDHDWGMDAPLSGMGVDNFSIRWTGLFDFENDDYVFTASVDDGIRVYVDGDVVLESWQNQPDTTYTETVPMSAGEHEVMVEYYESHSTASVDVSWMKAGESTVPAPNTGSVIGPQRVPASRDVTVTSNRRSNDVFVAADISSGEGDCSYADPCTLSEGFSRGGHVWLFPGIYSRSSSIRVGSDVTIESIDPERRAVIDANGFTDPVVRIGGDDNVLRNIVVRNGGAQGVYIGGNRNLLEGVDAHDNLLSGFHIYASYDSYPYGESGSYNTIRDCRAYDNSDAGLYGGPGYDNGGNADGISISSGEGNVIMRCEVFRNSDDGYDTWRSTNSLVSHSIAHHNGIASGNARGFKSGGPDPGRGTIVRHSIAYENGVAGCDWNSGDDVTFEYVTSWNNPDGFKTGGSTTVEKSISASEGVGVSSSSIALDNSWQRSGSVSFVSTDPESSDFLRPVAGSGFEDIGAYAESPYNDASEPSEPTDPATYCGDGVCEGGETAQTCSADCSNTNPTGPPTNVPTGTFRGDYYNGQNFDTFVTSRTDSEISFDYGQGSPMNGIDEDYFSVRWSGRFDFENDEYAFVASVDDGIRIYVDGVEVLESWQNQPDTTYTETVPMTAGEHEIVVEYYESHSTASVDVSWAPADEVSTPTDPSTPSFDGTYGARPVPRSKTPSSGDTFVSPSGGGSTCSQSSPCSLSTGLSRTGYIWLTPGTYYPSSRVYVGSDRIMESIDPNDKALLDFRGSVNGMVLQGDESVLRNVIVRRSSNSGVMVTGNRNLIEGVTSEHNFYSGFQVYRSWGMDVSDTSKASFNVFRDCIANYNNDDCCAESCGASTCGDSDADGIGFSAGVGNVIDHCEAFYNTDDGYDFWKSYESTITNSIAGRNGYDDLNGFENNIRRGNGNGFKMGGGGVDGNGGDTDNGHVVIGNWAYENAAYPYVRNSGTGQEFADNVCGTDQESCTWSW